MATPSREDHAYDELQNNYFTLIDAMKFTTEGLEGIVKRSMKDLYEKIYNKCHGMQPCIDNCTAIHGSEFKKWCSTCTKWKEVIRRSVFIFGLPGTCKSSGMEPF